MIDKRLEPYYDIIFSIFIGIILIIVLYSFYECPRTITIVDRDADHLKHMKKSCVIDATNN